MKAQARPDPLRMVKVGVTGHRVLPQADEVLLRRAVARVLDDLASRTGVDRAEAGRRSLVSALAEGSDRLVAEEALAKGWVLEALLPFTAEEYLEDFPDPASRRRFRSLLERATRVVELDGPMIGRARSSAYAVLAEHLVEAVDVLIAIWDGKPARGEGGTETVLARARSVGLPVAWVEASAPHRIRWLKA